MRAIDRRLRRLQERFAPEVREEDFRLVTLLRERRRRRLEASGEPFESRPCEQRRRVGISLALSAGSTAPNKVPLFPARVKIEVGDGIIAWFERSLNNPVQPS